MKHRGEIIESAVRKSGISITEVARRLGKSRRHLYNIFEDPNVSIDVILQIGKIIHHDFSSEIYDIQKLSSEEHIYNDKDQNYSNSNQAEYWKNKYLELLEKYNKMLEKSGNL